MNKLLALLVAATMSFGVIAAEKEKVCIDKIGKDGKVVVDKAGKPVQECKMMKKHKKLEGTEVPNQKK